MPKINKYNDAIEGLEAAIEAEQRKIEDAQENIRAFKLSALKLKEMNGIVVKSPVDLTASAPNGSLINWVAEQLESDGVPQTNRELYNKRYTGNKKPAFATFSGAVSGYAEKGEKIKRHTFKGNPNATKHYMGLPEWFDDNGKLKKEYLDKI